MHMLCTLFTFYMLFTWLVLYKFLYMLFVSLIWYMMSYLFIIEREYEIQMIRSFFRLLTLIKGYRWATYHLTIHTIFAHEKEDQQTNNK